MTSTTWNDGTWPTETVEPDDRKPVLQTLAVVALFLLIALADNI